MTTPNDSMRRAPWARVAILAAVFVGLAFYYWGPNLLIRFAKAPATTTNNLTTPPELVYSRPSEIEPSENGFYSLARACELMPEPPQTLDFALAWARIVDGDWSFARSVSDFLTQCAPAWTELDDALSKSRWLCPTNRWGDQPFLPSAKLRYLAQSKAINAKRLIFEGKADEAVGEAAKLIQLGRALQDCHGGLVETVTGAVIEGLGASTLLQAVSSLTISPEALHQVAILLPEEFSNYQTRWTTTIKVMHQAVTRDVIKADNPLGLSLPAPLLDRQATYRQLAADFLVELKNIKSPFPARDANVQHRVDASAAAIERLKDDVDYYRGTGRLTWRLLMTPNPFGLWVQYAAVPASERIEAMSRQHYFLTQAVGVVAAALLYERGQGELPESLNVLKESGLLPSIPQDPFDFQPLRYSKEKRRTWSVAMDGRDEGGERPASLDTSFGRDGDWVIDIPTVAKPADKIPLPLNEDAATPER